MANNRNNVESKGYTGPASFSFRILYILTQKMGEHQDSSGAQSNRKNNACGFMWSACLLLYYS